MKRHSTGIDKHIPPIIPPQRLYKIRHQVRTQLRKTGFVIGQDEFVIKGKLSKKKIRKLHSGQRSRLLAKNELFIAQNSSDLLDYFASGTQIEPSLINPELVEVKPDSIEARLFKFASLYWSVPVSQGFGRM